MNIEVELAGLKAEVLTDDHLLKNNPTLEVISVVLERIERRSIMWDNLYHQIMQETEELLNG
jgi:hypothetical protein